MPQAVMIKPSMCRIRVAIVLALFAIGWWLSFSAKAAQLNGIDVSHWEGDDIQWTNVYNAGYVFAFTKATEGTGFIDNTLGRNMTNARTAGVLIGCYHFARPNNNSATAEADFFISIAGKYMTNGYLRPVLDIEDGYQLGKAGLSTWVNTFVNRVKSVKGVEPLVYCNPNYAINYLNTTVTNWVLWIAHYNVASPLTGVWPDWKFWQYSETGTVPGINYATDLDVFKGTLAELSNYVIGGATNPPTITVQPANTSTGTNGTASFTVVATGSGTLYYRWQKNNANLNNTGHYSGVYSATLQISNADYSDIANYRCVVTNAHGSMTSSNATLMLVASCVPNPLVNGNFEGTNISGAGAGWTAYEVGSPSVKVWSIQTASSPEGSQYQQIQVYDAAYTASAGVRQNITGCIPGATYRISGWYRSNSDSGRARVRVSPSASTDWTTAVNLSPVADYGSLANWTTFTGTVVATGSSMTLWLDGRTIAGASAKVGCFDGITVTCEGAPVPLHIDSFTMLPQKQVRLMVSGEPGETITIQRSSNLVNWVNWTNRLATNGTVQFTDSTTNAAYRYYRAKTP